MILVGDSAGNVFLGYDNTVPVTMTEMVVLTKAVARGVKSALIVSDLPFGSYQTDIKLAVSNAIDLAKAGANAVKLEGVQYKEAIVKIIEAGIPVMGHLGFTPQSVNKLGYRVQGIGDSEEQRILREAKTLEDLGCFAIVLELIPDKLSKRISDELGIPTIGIGAGKSCDGQILVTYDMLGLYDDSPKFAKKYANLRSDIKSAVKKYIIDIK